MLFDGTGHLSCTRLEAVMPVTPEPTLVAGQTPIKLEQHYSQLQRHKQDCCSFIARALRIQDIRNTSLFQQCGASCVPPNVVSLNCRGRSPPNERTSSFCTLHKTHKACCRRHLARTLSMPPDNQQGCSVRRIDTWAGRCVCKRYPLPAHSQYASGGLQKKVFSSRDC